jgi:hypothetical protein
MDLMSILGTRTLPDFAGEFNAGGSARDALF